MPNPQYLQRAKKVQMYYDPRGQVVRTVNPDSTEQWVVFGKPGNVTTLTTNELGLPKPNSTSNGGPTPWESYSYDANDLEGRTHPVESAGSSGHWNTPSSSLLDPLGRTIKTVDRNGSQTADEVVMQYQFDIRGNLLKVTDALNRIAFTHVYDLKPKSGEEDQGANILKTTHLDSGTKTALFDAAHRPTELRDAKGALILHGYDQLNRPTRIWARDIAAEDVTLRQKLIYGDDTTDGPSTPTDTNHLGKLYQHYDEAGKVTMDGYDFKGNLLEKTRKVISDAELLSVFGGGTIDCYRVDWETSTDSILGTEDFKTDTSFDALNRPKQITYPEDVNTDRKVATPTYNRAGALESVDFDGTDFVKHIAYNAKGQRLLIAFGNGVMTRYAYDSETFRLTRQRSETYIEPVSNWTYVSGGNLKQDTGYQYDLSGNIIRTTERATNCGVGGSNALDKNYQYDALYRLLQATGRENAPTITPIWDDRYRSTDHSITTAYTQNYSYDKMGNILKLQHIGNSNFTRIFNPTGGYPPDDYGASNLLNEVKIGGTTYDFTYDNNGNLIQENASRFMEWDHADKMRCFYIDDGGTVTKYAHYLYDAGGNRVKKLVRNDGGSYTSTTNVDGIYEYLTDGTDEQSLSHIMDDKSRIAMVFEGDMFGDPKPTTRYVVEDHLGNSVNELKDDGADIEKEEYYPFGETSFASYSKKRYKYNGKERDEESGFYNYGMRYYSPWICRFTSVDPIYQDYPHYSPFQYAGNKPITYIDLDGLEEEVCWPCMTIDRALRGQPLSQNRVGATDNVFVLLQDESNGEWKKFTAQSAHEGTNPVTSHYVIAEGQPYDKQTFSYARTQTENFRFNFRRNQDVPSSAGEFYGEIIAVSDILLDNPDLTVNIQGNSSYATMDTLVGGDSTIIGGVAVPSGEATASDLASSRVNAIVSALIESGVSADQINVLPLSTDNFGKTRNTSVTVSVTLGESNIPTDMDGEKINVNSLPSSKGKKTK